MNVSIGDLDYYYAKNKVNCFNPDVMKIASYHEQLGDIINFVLKEDDINRPYDLYYIIREKNKTPVPPTKFYFMNHIRGWGKANQARINGRMSDAMLGCRPDYLLYPEHNTRLERSEQIRLFNNNAELLPMIQNYTNTFTNKYVIVTDPCMGFADKKSIISALEVLQTIKKVSFLEPIGLQKIIYDKDIKNAFGKLNFTPGSKITGNYINLQQVEDTIIFINEFKTTFPRIKVGNIIIDYKNKNRSHGEDKQNALDDFNNLKKLILYCKTENFPIQIKIPTNRFETPYFLIFEEIAMGTKYNFNYSGLEFITEKYGKIKKSQMLDYGIHPNCGNEVFRDLLRQTGEDKDFLLSRINGNKISENDIPGELGKKEFKYGI